MLLPTARKELASQNSNCATILSWLLEKLIESDPGFWGETGQWPYSIPEQPTAEATRYDLPGVDETWVIEVSEVEECYVLRTVVTGEHGWSSNRHLARLPLDGPLDKDECEPRIIDAISSVERHFRRRF